MKVKKNSAWSAMAVRSMCIRERFYTRGDCADYNKMLNYVDEHRVNPDDVDIWLVAEDILEHTSNDQGQTIENIMYILANDVIKYFYEMDEVE